MILLKRQQRCCRAGSVIKDINPEINIAYLINFAYTFQHMKQVEGLHGHLSEINTEGFMKSAS